MHQSDGGKCNVREVTLVSERDLGEAGFDVSKRDRGRTVSIGRGNAVVGRYKSE